MSKKATERSGTSAYSLSQQNGESPRQTEARALTNCANRLRKAQEDKGNFDEYIDAIRHNQQLWTLFQSTITETTNQLPVDLKITLLNLSKFVDKVSLRASAEYNPDLLTSLIEINRQIAAGLSTSPEEAHA
ncbi:MAG: flagellar biosynthesis regulator FlaF [Alphaproteobacteria bacterium]|nr:MAG: flagellar biosynthesis regulator FlaF [Alphaproteobacteria bacterium]